MKISYECSELIEELKQDIVEFGDKNIYAIFKKINGVMVLYDYDFTENKLQINDKEIAQIMKSSEVLKVLEEQNSII